MDYTLFIYLTVALFGMAYALLYRYVFVSRLKWKMKHSIWLPLIWGILVTGYGIYLLMNAGAPGSWNDLIGVVVLIVFNIPVVSFFITYAIIAFFDRKSK
jgi:amino acid transporter